MNTSHETLLTVNQVAARLQVKNYTVREWLKDGRLRGAKPGGKEWRIRERDLDGRIEPRSENPLQKALKLADELAPLLSGAGKFNAAELVNTMREERTKELNGNRH